jgi:hypothetical protein
MPHGARLEFVASYADGFRTLRLFRVTGAQGALADAIVAQQTPDPALLEADYEALSASRASVGRWIVFPSNHANSLIGHLGMWVVPLQIGEWPFTQAVARQALSALDFSADGEVLGVVIVDEVNVDPQRLIASALQQRIYRATEAWHGVLHCMTYVTGPADPGFSPVHGRFEGGISVVEAAILDFQVQPGGAVRMALVWNTPVPIRDSFKVFVHVVDAGGNLRAQHDSIPGGGLLPMTIWQPRQNVVDRIAILLPVDLPPGEYEIRLGIYHPESGLRLPVLSAAEAGPDYVLLGRVTVAAQ